MNILNSNSNFSSFSNNNSFDKKIPLILDIRGNSLDDGPGIRTVIFFKGCPLSCIWCHNPESKSPVIELGYDSNECVGCRECLKVCKQDALNPKLPEYIIRDKCNLCFSCVDVCPSGALYRVGMKMSIEEILRNIESDIPFFKNSGGGVTLSGGEPTLFIDFCSELIQNLKDRGIHTLLETCGNFNLEKFDRKIYPYIDQIYFDLKIMNPNIHRKYCGISNDQILSNFRTLFKRSLENQVPIMPRIPLIPEITATRDNLENIAQFLRENSCDHVVLLEYNPTWLKKSEKLGKKPTFDVDKFMSRDEIEYYKLIFQDYNISILK